MKLVIHFLLSALAVWVADYLLGGISVDNYQTLVVLVVVLAVVNTIVKPILKIITLPLNLITLGLFSVVLNVLLILLVEKIVPGFHVDGFFSALYFSLVLGLVHFVLKPLD